MIADWQSMIVRCGMRGTGIGHENGQAAVEHYTRLKSAYVELGGVACQYA